LSSIQVKISGFGALQVCLASPGPIKAAGGDEAEGTDGQDQGVRGSH